ncbi:hypothetical protein I6A60_19110 [Frankia sp. AgB1.9]|uniref:hypothetical protein n=1 Tax=unclassified Frankia TaxID=2632575 RepID=UPI0019325B98|nr:MULTISPECIES: hypothetical protein [unclassified Frankia]MBL7487904.1 hypothetical protein [Frankia sp. AgW1.1]MBL7549970.1 hypothetical protein [Frankia sp. AgB1.9]MBL7621452.1 hypothetical protein [Frankia sp. AgB1.8]
MDRDEMDFETTTDADLPGRLDVGWWRGAAGSLPAEGPRNVEIGLALLYHALAGLLASPLVEESRALRARTEITGAIGELEFAGVNEAATSAPVRMADDRGPLSWEEIRVVLRAAVAELRGQVAAAPDPVAVAQAVIAARRALAELE